MKREKRLSNILEALSRHEDTAAEEVLERLGTNSADDEVRRITARALVNRNTHNSLSVVISKKGKGVNDLNTSVAMSTINEILGLKDSEEVMKVLTHTEENSNDEMIKETARSIKALIAFTV